VTPLTILIVDDSVDLLDLYSAALSKAGYRPTTATSAEAAVRTLTIDLLPCAVVTDLTLGGVEGWRLIRRLKGDPLTRSIPIVVLTGCCDPSVAILGREAGCAAVLIKPCLPDELAAVLRRVLPADSAVA
jgi:two-component system phosphate regulon response regulator PhoB